MRFQSDSSDFSFETGVSNPRFPYSSASRSPHRSPTSETKLSQTISNDLRSRGSCTPPTVTQIPHFYLKIIKYIRFQSDSSDFSFETGVSNPWLPWFPCHIVHLVLRSRQCKKPTLVRGVGYTQY